MKKCFKLNQHCEFSCQKQFRKEFLIHRRMKTDGAVICHVLIFIFHTLIIRISLTLISLKARVSLTIHSFATVSTKVFHAKFFYAMHATAHELIRVKTLIILAIFLLKINDLKLFSLD